MGSHLHGRLVASALAVALCGCTNAGLYALDDRGPGRPDRAAFEGLACIPPAQGEVFPTKVLFAIEGGDGVPSDVVAEIGTALNDVAVRFSLPHVSFSLLAHHTVATGLLGSFQDGTELQLAAQRYVSYQEVGPISVRAPLRLARSILSGDMLSSCRGEVGRTRYLVVLLVLRPDTSCSHPEFNADISPQCASLPTTECSVCELSRVTSTLMDLMNTRGAGQITVQPMYIRTDEVSDPVVSEQLAAIARIGGTTPREVGAGSISAALSGLNYGSLQRELVLKRLIAFNRNAIARAGEELTDSDADGIPDVQELEEGLDPIDPDFDDDSLMDGVERRMGLDAFTANTISACNPFVDSDGDRLNDCEERVLGTDSCMGDTDGDGLPDLVEALMGTNPLVPEDLQDGDGDGTTNLTEILLHSDPLSADGAYRAEHGYGYELEESDPTTDGRRCYRVRITNVGLRDTAARPNPPFADIPQGTNDIYLYLQAGRENDPHGVGISALHVQQVRFFPPSRREPSGLIPLEPDQFVPGL